MAQGTNDLTPRGEPAMSSALLLLADGRFPAGGHAHSGGLEAAVGRADVHDVATMEAFLRGRLATVGVVAAAFAASACTAFAEPGLVDGAAVLAAGDRLDRELDARTPSPALRTASRRLGHQLLRVGRAVWPHSIMDRLADAPERGPHQPVAFGAVAAASGLGSAAAALAATHDAVLGPATAAVRLLGLDPFAVHAALARLGPSIDEVAAQGTRYAHTSATALPARAGPLLDIRAEQHTTWEVRLFAS